MATACSNPPAGRARWTLELLAGRDGQADRAREPVARDRAPAPGRERPQAVAQGHVVHSAGRRASTSRAWRTCSTSMPRRPTRSGRWSASTRARPSSSARCASRSRAEPGQLERYDCEYRRNGTANLFVFLDAHRPWRKVKVTERRTARGLRRLHARARRRPLPRGRAHPRGARQPVDPFGRRALPDLPGPTRPGACCADWSSTTSPKHASWLNMVEIEIGVLAQPMPRPPHRQAHAPRRRDRRLGEAAQRRPAHASTGCSQPKRPAPKWAAPIPGPQQHQAAPKNQNLCDEVLVLLDTPASVGYIRIDNLRRAAAANKHRTVARIRRGDFWS